MVMKTPQEVVMEFEPLGKYKVRLVKEGMRVILDIREYIESETFTGFTRKGIRLSTTEHVRTLTEILDAVTKVDAFKGNGNGKSDRHQGHPEDVERAVPSTAVPPTAEPAMAGGGTRRSR